MDFDLTEEQRLLGDSVERLLADHYTFEKRRGYLAEPEGWCRALWSQYAELGLLGLPFAEQHGGFGGGAIETMLVMQAFGRVLALEPYLATVVLAGTALRLAGSEPQQAALVPQIGGYMWEGGDLVANDGQSAWLGATTMGFRIAGGVVGGLIGLVAGCVVSFFALVFFYFLGESTLVAVDIAQHVRTVRRQLGGVLHEGCAGLLALRRRLRNRLLHNSRWRGRSRQLAVNTRPSRCRGRLLREHPP